MKKIARRILKQRNVMKEHVKVDMEGFVNIIHTKRMLERRELSRSSRRNKEQKKKSYDRIPEVSKEFQKEFKCDYCEL